MDKKCENIAAFFSMLDRWDRAEGAVSFVNGWPPAEIRNISDARLLMYERQWRKARGLWAAVGFSRLHLILRGPNVTDPASEKR